MTNGHGPYIGQVSQWVRPNLNELSPLQTNRILVPSIESENAIIKIMPRDTKERKRKNYALYLNKRVTSLNGSNWSMGQTCTHRVQPKLKAEWISILSLICQLYNICTLMRWVLRLTQKHVMTRVQKSCMPNKYIK